MEYKLLTKLTNYGEFLTGTQFLLLIIGSCITWSCLQNLVQWLRRPKNSPPGPIGIPVLGYLPFLGPIPYKTFVAMKQKYGDIISVYMGRKYTVILSEYSVLKEVLSNTSAMDRAPGLFNNLPLGFGQANGEKWTEQRRFCLAATRDLGLGKQAWEDLVVEEATDFMEKLRNTEGKPTEVSHQLVQSLTSNIMSLLIGRKLSKEKEGAKVKMSVDFNEIAFTYLGPTLPATIIPGLRKLLEVFKIRGYDRAAQLISQFSVFMKDEIFKHKSSSDFQGGQDFINSYLQECEKQRKSNNKHYFSETMLEGNLTVLFLGGSDTVFTSLQWLFRLMAQYKDVQSKVHAELMEVLGKDGQAKFAERDKVPYTFAVMMESQRFSTIAPLIATRYLTKDVTVKGITIQKGTEIVGNIWALHHDPNYWKQPEKFNPDRFLTDNGTKLVNNPPSFAPFSVGKRNCPGETIAWRGILGYFTEIMKKFEISVPPGVEINYNVTTGLVERLNPMPLCFRERN